jgi:hypothetical protein
MNQGQSFSYVFYKHGFYPYKCSFHEYMTGWVNVTGSDLQPPLVTTPPTNYMPYAIAGSIAGAIVAVTVALFIRRRRQKPRHSADQAIDEAASAGR